MEWGVHGAGRAGVCGQGVCGKVRMDGCVSSCQDMQIERRLATPRAESAGAKRSRRWLPAATAMLGGEATCQLLRKMFLPTRKVSLPEL